MKGTVVAGKDMISVEEARELVLNAVSAGPTEPVSILDMIGRVVAEDIASDIDISPFDHSAMDGFALRSDDTSAACESAPVTLQVIGEEPAGSYFEEEVGHGQCVRIMTGAPLPKGCDAVQKYEVVTVVEGDGRTGSVVAFHKPVGVGDNVRAAGEEAKAGEVVVRKGELIHSAGVGFLASCGATSVLSYKAPTVALIATGSELVPASEVPGPGQIRNSNSYAMAACVRDAGAIPAVLPIAPDDFDGLKAAVLQAAQEYDFVVTTGGAANGDFDFIKQVIDSEGQLFMSTVNMRPGKAQAFGLVNGTPVFGLPGNPAAAYLGFEVLIRPALRKMQGYSKYGRPIVMARLLKAQHKKDPRRIYSRATLTKASDGVYEVMPAKNQSSGLFGPIQQANCFAILPEGVRDFEVGDMVECVMLDVPEEVLL